MGVRSPEDIKLELSRLIQEAQPVFPNLASRLGEMRRWIAEKKNGLLRSKRPVILLLTELVDDTDFWLAMQSLPSDDRDALLDTLSPLKILVRPNHKGNGKGEGWMPVFRIFRFLFGSWFESDPRTRRDTPTDRRNIIDDLDISEDNEENGHSQR